jgi:hypothetical protein
MSIENTSPEITNPNAETIQQFRNSANQVIKDFNILYINGFGNGDGTSTKFENLHGALDKVSEQANINPSILSLLKAVNSAREIDANLEKPQIPRNPRLTPEFAILNLFGGAVEEKHSPTIDLSETTTERSSEPERARRFGHQIVVDGHVVYGYIGPHQHEVTTSKGILRTYGTPRLG